MDPDSIISEIIDREGGFVDDPDDPGGATRYGITLATLADWRGAPVSREDVARLDREEARRILLDRYYQRPGLPALPLSLQAFLTDSAVNHGPAAAIRMLQTVLNAVSGSGLATDGALGPISLAQAMTEERRLGPWLLRSLIEERRRFYFRIVAGRPASGKFLRGWINRAQSFEPDQETMSGHPLS